MRWKEKTNPLAAVSATCLLLLLVGCVCAALVPFVVFGSLGNLWEAVAGLFRREAPGEASLYTVLRNRSEGAFQLGQACEYTYTQGSVVGSDLEPQMGGFAGELSREQVIGTVSETLQGEVFQVQDGRIRSGSGEPVHASILEENRVSLNYSRQEPGGEGSLIYSLDGVVEGSRFQGSFHLEQTLSTVKNGQGVERAVTAVADLACPLQWLAAPVD